MYEGRLFIISGPSGAGKGTICKLLAQEVRASLSISMTTRKPRQDETDGENYYFVSHEEFERVIETGGFLEHARVYGNYYGTPKQKVLEKLAQATDVILEIDTQGAMQVKKKHPRGIFIFILPPSMTELKKRLISRGSETEDSISVRMNEVVNEISYIDKYDYCVVNDELFEALNKVKAIIAAEHSRVSQDTYTLIEKYKEEV